MSDTAAAPPPGGSGPDLATPLVRLYGTAHQLGIIVLDAVDDDGPWLDEDTSAIVACGVCIALSPGLQDESLRADVLAMALAVTYVMHPRETGQEADITAGSIVLISRRRVADPGPGPGSLATVIAREHGCDTPSAAFEYATPVFG